jgi:Reverse transcriptase (RNA-dependent DNA polymerase)
MIIYTDDTIITGPDEQGIDDIIQQISQHFKITSAETVTNFLGVHLHCDIKNKTISMTQTVLIQSIIRDVGLNDNSNGRETPAYTNKTMTNGSNTKPHHEKWNYRGVIGKLNYLEKHTRPDISYAVHQCARYMSQPTEEHGKAVKAIVRYLISTKDKGLICSTTDAPIECFCDADVAGNYHRTTRNSILTPLVHEPALF